MTHFPRVTAISDLVSAVLQSIDHKLERAQRDGTAHARWLLVVLDEGKAATQSRSVTESDNALLNLDGITFPRIYKVWVVAFEGRKLTVLQFTGAGSRWYLHRGLDPQHTSRRPDRQYEGPLGELSEPQQPKYATGRDRRCMGSGPLLRVPPEGEEDEAKWEVGVSA